MKFELVDDILERSDDRIVVVKLVSRAEEYLQDHFPGFPVLPGVMMIEAMVQAARILLADRFDDRVVLGEVKALKYGSMVRPGDTLRIEVTSGKTNPDGSISCRGTGRVIRANGTAGPAGPDGSAVEETAVGGRFTMRELRPVALT